MQARKWKIDSWHGRLAFYYGPVEHHLPHDWPRDICSYTRAVFKGAMAATVIAVICGLIAGAFADWAIWAYFYLFETKDIALNWPGFFAAGATCIIGGWVGFLWCVDTLQQKWRAYRKTKERTARKFETDQPPRDPKPTPFRDMWRAFKDKTCFRITLE